MVDGCMDPSEDDRSFLTPRHGLGRTNAMTDTVATSLSPGDVFDVPVDRHNDIADDLDHDGGESFLEDDDDLNYLGTSVFDIEAMARLSLKSTVST